MSLTAAGIVDAVEEEDVNPAFFYSVVLVFKKVKVFSRRELVF